MARTKEALIIMLLVWWGPFASATGECSAVTQAFSACSAFICGRWAGPAPGSPCCNAVSGLNVIASSSSYEKRVACICLMGLIASNSPAFSSIAALPGLCGVSLGFTIQPEIDCDSIV